MYSIIVLTNDGKCLIIENTKSNIVDFPLHFNYFDKDLTLNANEVALYFIKNNHTQAIKAWSKDDGQLVYSNESRIAKKFNSIVNKVKQFSKVGA